MAGHTVRADFEGGALSLGFRALLLRGIDRQIGLTSRLAAAIRDRRHPSYVDHPLCDLIAQRVYQIASGYANGNDANSLRHDPLFKLSLDRLPLEDAQALASAPPARAWNTRSIARMPTASLGPLSSTLCTAIPSRLRPLS